jgi:hypothetical protein
MWWCFNSKTVLEPTKINLRNIQKPLRTEVPVTVKPVTLMFRLPSDNDDKPSPLASPAPEEEVPVLCSKEPECNNNPCTIIFTVSMIAILYMLMLESELAEL